MVLLIVQIALIVASIRAFRQEWQVELEVPAGSTDDFSPGGSLPEPGAA